MSKAPARRCPDCGTVNHPTVPSCECGFIFDAAHAYALGMIESHEVNELEGETLSDQRHFHLHQLTMGWFMVVGGVLALLVSPLLAFVRLWFMLLAVSSSVGLLMKGVRDVGSARRHLRILGGKGTRLPKAQLVA